MATLAQANLPSDDEEDVDYCPSEEDEDNKNSKASLKRHRGIPAGTSETAAHVSEHDDRQEQLVDSRSDARKAKIDAIWSKLNTHGTLHLKHGKEGRARQGIPVEKSKVCKDEPWMRQLGLGSSKIRKTAVEENKKSVAAAALAAAKTATSATAAHQHGRVIITELRRFAGKDVVVKKEVAADSREAQKAGAPGSVADDAEAVAARKQAGLDAVLASLAQPKKVTVLDKSRSDWKDLKGADDKLEEELESYKKSSSTYLSKKEFLQRAELREYEQERDKRLASDMRNRGRL